MSPLNTDAPLASLMSTLCGWPASLLSKWMVKAAPAGADTSFCSNWTPCAEIWTAVPPAPPLAGACELGACEFGASEPGTCDAGSCEDGAPDAGPPEPEAAGCDGGGDVGAA